MPDYSFLDTWEWKYPHPQGNTLNDAAITAGPYYAAVGDHETLIYSSNATDWTVGGMGNIPLNGIAFGYTISGPGVVVAVGMHGTIFSGTSFDDMVLRIVPTSNNLNKVIFDSGHFYAVGDNGTIVSSQDGITWGLENPGAGGNINDIASGIVNGTGRRIASVSIGVLLVWESAWVPYAIPGCSITRGIAIGTEKVAVISDSQIWVSTNLINWTAYATSSSLVAISYVGNYFFASSTNGSMLRSQNGSVWESCTVPGNAEIRGFAFAGQYMAFGSYGAIYRSDDGMVWSWASSDTTVAFGSIYYNMDRYIAIGAKGTILTLTDGSDWQPADSHTTATLNACAYGDGKFVIAGDRVFLYSTEGLQWTLDNITPTTRLYGIAYGKEKFVAVGELGVAYHSESGIIWNQTMVPSSARLYGITCFKDRFIAVGEGGILLTSANGINWDSVESGVVTDLHAVANSSDLCIAVGSNGTVTYSRNGREWTRYNIPVSIPLRSVCFAHGIFVIATDYGHILWGIDGLEWQALDTNTSNNLYSIAPDDYSFWTAGNGSAILRSGLAYPKIFTAPDSYDFGNIPIGSSSDSEFIVKNMDLGDLLVETISLDSPDSSQFEIVADCSNQTIPYLSTGTITVRFRPDSAGGKLAYIRIPSNDLETPVASITLNGTGEELVPAITVTPASADFGNVAVGTTSQPLLFTVGNRGDGRLVVSEIMLQEAIANEFRIENDNCTGQMIPPGGYRTFEAVLTPASTGLKQAAAVIFSNDPGTPAVNIPLLGIGTAARISIAPQEKNFGNVTIGTASAPQQFIVQNTGSAGLVVNGITLQGTDAGEFSIRNDNCTGQLINPGAFGTFEAVFTPVSSGAKKASLVIQSNDSAAPTVFLPLAGMGQTLPIIHASPSAKAFGDIQTGLSSLPQLFTITNEGDVPLIIGLVGKDGADSGSFRVQNDNCSGRALNHGESVTFEVVFAPLTVGWKKAIVNIPSNDPVAPIRSVPVSGRGVAAHLSVEPPGRNFGDVRVGSASAPQTFTVENTGTADLVLGAVLIIGDDAAQYLKHNDHCSGCTFAPGSSGTFEIIFKPSSEGMKIAGIRIPSNDPDTPVRPVPIIGNGTAVRDIVSEPPEKVYPPAVPGSTPRYEIYTVINRAAVPVTTGRVHIAEPAPAPELASSAIAVPAAPPSAVTAAAATLAAEPTQAAPVPEFASGAIPVLAAAVTHSAATVPEAFVTTPTAMVAATAASVVSAVGAAISAASGASAAVDVVLSRGSGDTAGQSFRAGDTEQFRLRNDQISGRTLQPNESATLEAAFIPEYPGVFRAEIVIPTDYAMQPELRIPLAGIAPVGPRISVWPFTYDFGEIMVGGRSANVSFSVASIGSSGLFITDIFISGKDSGMFRIVKREIPDGGVQPGESAAFEVVFAPSSEGCREATVQIYSNDIRVPVCTAWLYGRGDYCSFRATHTSS